MMSRAVTLLALAVLATSASAQVATVSDEAFAASLAAARAATPARPAKPAAGSCPDAKELETAFDMHIVFLDGRAPLDLHLEYAGCRTEDRNDYLPPYTERDYAGPNGYGLTLTTDDGAAASEALLSRGTEWVARLGLLPNAVLVSGEALNGVPAAVKFGPVAVDSKVTIRATDGVFPTTRACDAGIAKLAGSSPRGSRDTVATGFNPGPSLVLLTDAKAYYYHEDCDICAELDECDLKTGATRAAIVAHSVSCSDLQTYAPERGVVYNACPAGR